MKMNKKTLLFFIIGILVLCSTVAQAATSKQRDANKIYDPLEVSIRINKKNVKFVIVNNRVDPKRWYYMTLEPKFVEYGDPLEPALMLINYQRYGANKSKSEIEEGAYFECIFDMSVDTKVLKELKSKLPKEVDRTRICFEPLPLDLVEMTLLGTEGKEIKIEADKTAGILPMDASYVRFATILDKNDANLLNIALNSNTGIGYSIRYNYSLVGTKKKTSIKYSLDGNKGDYETDSKEEFSDEINNYLKRKVNSLSFQRKLREQVKPVDDENVNVLDVGHSRNKQTSGKSNTTIEHIEKVAEFEYRGKNDFIKVCEGFLSLDKYSFDIIKRKIFLDTSDVLWQMAYLVMPDMGAVNPLAVKKIETSIQLLHKNSEVITKKYFWDTKRKWYDEDKESASIVRFGLDSVLALSGKNPLDNCTFEIKTLIDFENDDSDIEVEQNIPVINGYSPVSNIMCFVDSVTFDFSELFWDDKTTSDEKLTSVDIVLRDDKRICIRTLKPEYIDNTRVLRYPDKCVIPTTLGNYERGRVTADVYFHVSGKKIAWEYNGSKLNSLASDKYLTFFDEDWQK